MLTDLSCMLKEEALTSLCGLQKHLRPILQEGLVSISRGQADERRAEDDQAGHGRRRREYVMGRWRPDTDRLLDKAPTRKSTTYPDLIMREGVWATTPWELTLLLKKEGRYFMTAGAVFEALFEEGLKLDAKSTELEGKRHATHWGRSFDRGGAAAGHRA